IPRPGNWAGRRATEAPWGRARFPASPERADGVRGQWLLDTSAVDVSLPHIAGNLSATTDEATWVLTPYLVANAIILPMSGWLENCFGRKRMLLTVSAKKPTKLWSAD